MVFLVIILFLMVFIGYHLIRYRNPYKLIFCIGKKGSGKTTLMVKLALKYHKCGRPVYCNAPDIPGTYYFSPEDLGSVGFPENAVIMVDEASRYWDNRDFKSFSKKVFDYFRFQRKYRHTVYMFSQSFDVDKKLRDLSDRMYLITNVFNCFSVARGIAKGPTITHADSNNAGESKLVDDIHFESLLLFWAGSVRITYIPKYAKYFNSYDPPYLPEGTFQYTPFPEKKRKLPQLRPRLCPAWRRKQEPEVLETSADKRLLLDNSNSKEPDLPPSR